LLAVIVVAALLTVSAQRALSRVAHWESLAGGLQADIATPHVWLEELITTDPTIDPQRLIFGPLDRAQRSCRALRDGRGGDNGQAVAAVDDPLLRADVVAQCRELATLRALTVQRIAQRTPPGTPQDQAFDAQFTRTLGLAQRMPPRLRQLASAQENRVASTETGTVIILGSALVLAAALIRRRQDELERVAREHQTVLQSAGEGILAIDGDGTIRFANGAAGVLLATGSEDLTGRPIGALVVDEAEGNGAAPLWLRPGPGQRTAELRRNDGTSLPIEYTATSADDDAHAAVVVTFRDITARRRREGEQESELDELRAMKATLVPSELPDRTDLKLATCFLPAKSGVGGDFYLVTDDGDDATTIVVGDVAGKGVGAARCAAFVRTSFATFASYTQKPSMLLELANRALLEDERDFETLVTAACVVVRPARQTVTWALAGHAPSVRLDDGTPMAVKPGLPLGLESKTGAQDATAPLPPGAGFVIFTDGLYEARAGSTTAGAEGGHFGLQRISEVVAHMPGAEPGAVVDALRQAIEDFAEGALTDDLCILATRTSAAPSPAAAEAAARGVRTPERRAGGGRRPLRRP
jgi:sigma-B regulation protein RsbU (phosphoserine phosphatase)